MTLTTQLNLSYKQAKLMKKRYGQYLGYQIALGRKVVKFMKEKYKDEK